MMPAVSGLQHRLAGLGRRHVDPGIAAGLFVAYLGCLLGTANDLGYARDEGFYFRAAESYASWFSLLFHDPMIALSREGVDRFWSVNHEHPALLKTLFALSHQVLHEWLGIFSEPGTAFRFPAMVLAALGVSVVFLWGARELGRAAGLFAAVALGAMPRFFFHAHLACFDVPVATLWLVTAYLYARSLTSKHRGLLLLLGVVFGLLLDTKHNAWLLPPALVAHWLFGLVTRPRGPGSAPAPRLPPGLVALGLIGPIVFFLGWPWLWFDTTTRLADYVRFHLGHEYYNMEFLGRTYWKPPMPWAYAWLMTLATVPLVTLATGAIGAVGAVRRYLGSRVGSELGSSPSVQILWLLCVLASYAPWWLSSTPIFGGTKHWLTAYPFWCLLAGRGFAVAAKALSRESARFLSPRAVRVGLLTTLTAGPVVMTAHSRLWGLSSYTPLVGGASGAATLGLNRTFWGYTTGALTEVLNRRAPPSGRIYLHDTTLASFEMLKRDGRLRADLRGTLDLADSDLALYHHEPHMRRVESQIWVEYGTDRPLEVLSHDGVPVVLLYRRPRE